ncbi:hypothetical protein QAD02_022189 [Eretmocerus hayati]|uniref:Uncharacterized protein n=1 Tax=Eretmocerus hayati TaxID=131215 RepID=A0ACC2PS15_9HYME|nr:hypothetical protein QAD02_022189 [Eretmocerus hayati]
MQWIVWILIVLQLESNILCSQNLPPQVNPSHYQQAPPVPNQQYQQPPPNAQQYQYQQAQQPQYQQHPPQQPIPQANQQYNQHQAHHAHHAESGHPQQVLHSPNIAQEKEHIAEHAGVPIDTSKMSEQELQFHYFKMHDADNNNKLDGCELIKSLIHWHEEGNKDPNAPKPEPKIFGDEELINLIDPILKMDDANDDGFIDYPEFVQAQKKAASNTQQP